MFPRLRGCSPGPGKDLKWLLTNPRNYLLWLLWHRSLESWTVSRTCSRYLGQSLCIRVETCSSLSRIYHIIHYSTTIILKIFLSNEKKNSDQSRSGNQSTISIISQARQDLTYRDTNRKFPRILHHFLCAPRHLFSHSRQIPKVILLHRSAIKIRS